MSPYQTVVHLFQSFKNSVPCYLQLDLGLRIDNDVFEVIENEEYDYSILGEWFITLWAKSMLQNNQIDGLMMDMTWKIIW
jgi:hypothetical protein